MTEVRINEKCNCGAEFNWVGPDSVSGMAVEAWRKNHRHDRALGKAEDEEPTVD